MTLLIVVGGLILIAITAVAIAWPLLRERDEAEVAEAIQEAAAAEDPLDELEDRRDSIYLAIRELQFDYQVGKVSDVDYQAFDSQLKAQAVAVLKEIDALEMAEADPDLDARIEAEIAALRHVNGHDPAHQGQPQPAGAVATAFCPQCGTGVQVGDRFCGKCGAAVA